MTQLVSEPGRAGWVRIRCQIRFPNSFVINQKGDFLNNLCMIKRDRHGDYSSLANFTLDP